MNGTLSSLPSNMMLLEDVGKYLRTKIIEMGDSLIQNLYEEIYAEEIGKDDLKEIETTTLARAMDIPKNFKKELVKFMLSQVHNEYMWLDKPYKITKEVIERVTRFNDIGEKMTTRMHIIEEVAKKTRCYLDGRMCTLKDILDRKV